MPGLDNTYIAIILLGIATGIILYFINLFIFVKAKQKVDINNKEYVTKLVAVKAVFVFLVCGVLAVVSGFLLAYLFTPLAWGNSFYNIYGLAFSYFYCATFLIFYLSIMLNVFKLNVRHWLPLSLPSVAITGAICRIACIITGCCGGITVFDVKVPTAKIEFAVALGLFFLFQFVKKTRHPVFFLMFYSILRFILEFFRLKTDATFFVNVLTITQVYAIIVVFICSLYLSAKKILKLRK